MRAPSIVGGAPGVPRSLRALMVTARGATPANGRWRLSMAGPVPSEIARRRAVDPELTRRLMSVKLSLDPTPAAALAAPRLDDRIWLALPERPAWTFDPPIMLEVPRFPTGGAGLAIKFRY